MNIKRIHLNCKSIHNSGFWIATIICIAAISIFILVAPVFVVEKKDILDMMTFQYLDQYVSDTNTHIALFVTFFGTGTFLIPLYTIIIFKLTRSGNQNEALIVFEISTSSLILGEALKEIFKRPRPMLHHLDGAGGFSFPSGHTLGAFTLCGILLYLTYKSKFYNNIKLLLYFGFFLISVMIGLSRIYLHVHYASDIIGSFFAALIWFMLYFIYSIISKPDT